VRNEIVHVQFPVVLRFPTAGEAAPSPNATNYAALSKPLNGRANAIAQDAN
jgi:hypothetical protein